MYCKQTKDVIFPRDENKVINYHDTTPNNKQQSSRVWIKTTRFCACAGERELYICNTKFYNVYIYFT